MAEHLPRLGEPETADQQREIDIETRETQVDLTERALEDRGRRLDRRTDVAEHQQREAGHRADAADERAAAQDRRDLLADRRDHLADDREVRADDRDRLADERDAGAERSWLDQREIDLEMHDTRARLGAAGTLPLPRAGAPSHPRARRRVLPVVTARLDLPVLAEPHVAAVVEGRRLPSWADDFPAEGDVDIARMLAAARAVSAGPYGARLVVERGSGLAVGTAGFLGPPHDGVVEIGYGIVTSRRGQGYATEAVRALLALVAHHSEVREVVAHADPLNAASIRVLEKNGLRRRPVAEPRLIQFALII